jgi:hypothetical protein
MHPEGSKEKNVHHVSCSHSFLNDELKAELRMKTKKEGEKRRKSR